MLKKETLFFCLHGYPSTHQEVNVWVPSDFFFDFQSRSSFFIKQKRFAILMMILITDGSFDPKMAWSSLLSAFVDGEVS